MMIMMVVCVLSTRDLPPMRDDDTVWFPCPLKEGRYFKMLSITQSGNIDVCEIELFGY